MAGEETKTEEAQTTVDVIPGGGSKIVMILTAANLALTVGVTGIVLVSFIKDSSQPSVEDIQSESGHEAEGGHGEETQKKSKELGRMVNLEQFTVNLATVGSVNPKYARVNVSIEVVSDELEIEINQKLPQVRNTVIDLFNSKRPSDLSAAEGRNYLKDEIRNALNSFLVSGQVKGVYFTNFAVSG